MTSYVTPKKNTAYKFYVALVDQSNTKLTKANPTIAAGDFKVSTDGGAFANLATLPSANPASGRAVMIDCSAGEMNGDNIVIQCVDAAGAEWCDLVINIQTSARQIDDLAFPATSGRSMVVDASGLVDANAVKVGPTGSGTAQTARDIGLSVLISSGTGTGQLNVTSGVIDANVTKWLGTACSTPTVAGVPNVNTKTWNDLATVALPLVPLTAGRALDVTAANKVNGVVLVDTLTTYTGNTVQTGDAYARIGAAGVGLTAVGLTGTQTFNNTGTWTGNIVGTLSTLTTYTGNTPQTGDSYARIGAAGAGLTSVALTSAYDFAKGTVAVTESYNADGAAPTPVQALMAILQVLTEGTVAGTTMTIKKLDGSTTAFTLTLNSSTAPTSLTRAT